MIYRTERHVLDLGEAGAFNAAYFRYPAIYGPRQPTPMEWSVVRRVRDGRSAMILPNGGLILTSRCAARNAAEYSCSPSTTRKPATTRPTTAPTTSSSPNASGSS